MTGRDFRGKAAALAAALTVGSGLILGAANQPKIKFKEVSHNFGKMKQGATAKYSFVFSNEGDALLLIKGVETSCGCTAALVTAEKIEPGKTGKIEVSFSTAGYGGQLSKTIFVSSNDPAEPRKVLEVMCEVEVPPSPKIEIEPYNYEGGLSLQGDPFVIPFKVMNKGELELRVEFVHRNAVFVINGKAAPTPLKIAAGKTADIEIRIPTDDRSGVIHDYILIKANDPIRNNMSLYTSGYIVTKKQLKDLIARYKDALK